jgi:hypothetical protein
VIPFENIHVFLQLAGEDNFHAEGYWWSIVMTVIAMLIAWVIFVDLEKRE